MPILSLFDWLFVAHMVGDWMLQNDWMANAKRGRWWSGPCLLHCTTYAVTLTVAAWIAGWAAGRPWPWATILAFGLFIFASHWLIDGFDVAARWGRLTRQSERSFVRIVVDQSLHLLVIAAAVLVMT